MTYASSSLIRLSLHHGVLLAVALVCVAGGAVAQTSGTPIPAISAPVSSAGAVGQPPAPRVGDVPSEVPNRAPVVGATARHLLAAQASGRVAAPAPPVYGATASLSWKRYVDSFSHPIPEFFESRVGKTASE